MRIVPPQGGTRGGLIPTFPRGRGRHADCSPPRGDTRGAHPSLPQGGGAAMRIVLPPLGGTRGGLIPASPKGEGLPCGMFAY